MNSQLKQSLNNLQIMGCDGGTIPRRDELVRLKKKPEAVSKIFKNNFLLLNFAIFLKHPEGQRI